MNKTFYLKYATILFSIIFLLCLFSPISLKTSPVSTKTKFANIIIQVKNNNYDSPVDNASICILNTKQYYYTKKNGYTESISIPLFDEYKIDDYYIYNLLIYKNGYNDYIYYGLKVKPSQKRADIIIPLIPIINHNDIETTLFFEPPYNKTIEEIIKENKK
jgi:hypothetical protein